MAKYKEVAEFLKVFLNDPSKLNPVHVPGYPLDVQIPYYTVRELHEILGEGVSIATVRKALYHGFSKGFVRFVDRGFQGEHLHTMAFEGGLLEEHVKRIQADFEKEQSQQNHRIISFLDRYGIESMYDPFSGHLKIPQEQLGALMSLLSRL